MTYQYTPPFNDLQKAQLREYMGYSQLFKSSNSIFENILIEIESVPAYDDGATFNQVCVLLSQLISIDQQIFNNATLGLATEVSAEVKFDAARNDAFLRKIGRTYVNQLSIYFSMKPARDYFGRSNVDTSGNIYPQAYSFDTDGTT